MFGLLSNRAAIVLGDISYGVYLLHGLLLSLTFLFILGPSRAATFDPLLHWAVVMIVGVVVVVASALTYRYIERPAMQRVAGLTSWLRRRKSAPIGKAADDLSRLS